MRTRRALRLAVVVATALSCALGPGTTTAHDNADQKWQKNVSGTYDWYIRYSFTTQIPSTAFKNRISDGAKAWNAVGRDFIFANVAIGGGTKITVGYEDLLWPNGDALAIETNYKQFGFGEIYQAVITFNSTPGNGVWYTGTGTPSGNQIDVWSVAAHEFGHAVALNHSTASADTMYPIIEGTSKRSLTVHDKDGISWFYPAH